MDTGILVVDDDELARIMMRDFLESVGQNVFLAEDELSALDALHQKGELIRLVVTDYSMPRKGDGVRLFHCIKMIRPELPVVLLSGQEFDHDHEIHQVGFNGIEVKSSRRDSLMKFIMKYMA
ncbi:MAG: Response regulator [Candidatus Moranbacteria bacterium GW2011_GWC2_37_8]|nr:MAG: Response regulator [Candidatus Moranbacteria bacterium GW2011_GWC2_37_8]KKQ63379.1 MAG: Response regulator [Parcubacteria group bacterium GW2011_GWC1_38_22]KKQ80972.1 MAG: Response regulator [Candidatus Moranbacteria bacterium GW2011_GWD2_38_7]